MVRVSPGGGVVGFRRGIAIHRGVGGEGRVTPPSLFTLINGYEQIITCLKHILVTYLSKAASRWALLPKFFFAVTEGTFKGSGSHSRGVLSTFR